MIIKLVRYLALAIAIFMLAVACNSDTQLQNTQVAKPRALTEENVLEIWWEKGFTLDEDEALRAVVQRWEMQTNNKVNLTFDTTDELAQKAEKSLQAGNPPDILMSHSAERILNPRLAWEGKLVDISDILEPVQNLYPEAILDAVNLYNNQDKKRSYYAVPSHQATIHIFYWRDLLAQAGYSESDIPQNWEAFWQFWTQVQDDLAAQNENIHALGFTISPDAGDTYYLFEQILEAYDIPILDKQGKLLVDLPEVRQGIIKTLKWYEQFYREDYIPPGAVNWLNPDNNRQLLNRSIITTPNATLSIPNAIRQDSETYLNKLGTIEFPNKPNGKPMRYLVTVKQAVIFTDSDNQKLAKDFLSYFIQPEISSDYLKASGGRNLPLLKPVWQDSYWTSDTDPHLSSAVKTLIEKPTRSFYSVVNPAYSVVQQENVWGKTLNKVLVEEISAEQAADEAISQIKEIFAEWE